MIRRTLLGALALLFVLPTSSNAQPDDLKFKTFRNRRTSLILRNCPLVEGAARVRITRRGARVRLMPRSLNREEYRIGTRYRHWACGMDATGDVVLYARARRATDPVVTINPSLSDFAERGGNGGGNNGGGEGGVTGCRSFRAFPTKDFIYKTVGSNHFTDVRRYTIGLIVRPGTVGEPRATCLNGRDTKGNIVVKLGQYARGEYQWDVRYYAGVGCGSSTPYNGKTVAARARKNTGDDDIYLEADGVCYGPFDADTCIGSAQC